MNFYDLLETLVRDSTMGEDIKTASREVIAQLRGINAFGTVIAGTESETQVPSHIHTVMTVTYKFDRTKIIDTCKECKAELGPAYLPEINRYPGYRGY